MSYFKRLFAFTFLILINYSGLFAQSCLPEGLFITENNDIDNFIANYPDCTNIEGTVFIDASDVGNLLAFQNILSIGGNLSIQGNTPEFLSHFKNLESIGGDLKINYTTGTGIGTGLNKLKTIGGSLIVDSNSGFSSLSALDSVETIGGDLQIIDNAGFNNNFSIGMRNLKTIEGVLHISSENGSPSFFAELDSLTSIGGLIIKNTDRMEDLDDLSSITSISGKIILDWNDINSIQGLENADLSNLNLLQFYGNYDLNVCSLDNICNYIIDGGATVIDNISGKCLTDTDFLEDCTGLPKLYHPIFIDLNNNGIYDMAEPYYGGGEMLIKSGHLDDFYSYNNISSGGFGLTFGDNIVTTLDTSSIPLWDLTTEISQITNLSSPVKADTVYFGIYPKLEVPNTVSHLSYPLFKCNETFDMSVMARNEGTSIASGMVWIEIDSNIVDVEYLINPDSILSSNRYGWSFSNLNPSHNAKFDIKLLVPEQQNLEEPMKFKSWVNYIDLSGSYDSDSLVIYENILCSYDPNDMLIYPKHNNEYTLFDDELIYTIRFQNISNDTVQRIEIVDDFSNSFDINTIEIIESSHIEFLSTSRSFSTPKTLNFIFDEIYLVDSTTNFEDSHGYVTFKIKLKEATLLSEGEKLTNSAIIYFDNETKITTNETETILVSSLDFDEDGVFIWDDCDDMDSSIYPGAEEIANNGIDEDCDGLDLMTSIFDFENFKLKLSPNPVRDILYLQSSDNPNFEILIYDITGSIISQYSNVETIDMSLYKSGVYFIEILDNQNEQRAVQKIIKD